MEYAFTDEMIRRDREELSAKALEYVRRYTGEFAPLVAAKRTLEAGYPLNVGQLRLILNTMRTDTSVVLNYTPPEDAIVIPFRPKKYVPFSDDPFGVDDEKPVERVPRWYKHPFKLKLPYGMSMQKRAEVIHLMSAERSYLEYHPVGSWFRGQRIWGQPYWHFKLYYECSEAAKKLQMIDEAQADRLVEENLMRYCRTCQQFRVLRG